MNRDKNEEEKTYLIYCMKNKINGKMYIGQTCNLKARLSNYKRLNCKDQPKIYAALLKYGFEGFEIIILDKDLTHHEANAREFELIREYNSIKGGYNCKDGGEVPPPVPRRIISTPQGEMFLSDASRVSGIAANALTNRIRLGWPPEKLFEPIGSEFSKRKVRENAAARGRSPELRRKMRDTQIKNAKNIDTPLGKMPLCVAEEKSGIRRDTLTFRINSGWPIDKLFDPVEESDYIDTPMGRMHLHEASKISGIHRCSLKRRIENGWPAEELFDPVRDTNITIETPMGLMNLCDAAKISGISKTTLRNRVKKRWPIEKLFNPAGKSGNKKSKPMPETPFLLPAPELFKNSQIPFKP